MLSIGLFVLAVHFSMVLVYTKPLPFPETKLDFIAFYYTQPYFQQSWKLFVPPPNANYRLFVEYEHNGAVIKEDIFNELLNKHQGNRFAGYGPILLSFVNSAHYFEKNTPEMKPLNGPVSGDMNFTILEHAALAYVNHKTEKQLNHVKLLLLVEDLPSGNKRAYFNRDYFQKVE